jgi:hypothetical protein
VSLSETRELEEQQIGRQMARYSRLAITGLALLGLALSVALLGGCSQKSATPEATAPTNTVAPPTVKIVEPVEGATIPAGDVKASVQTTGLKFVMPGNTNVPGQGHVHFTLDGRPLQMSAEPEYTFVGVASGQHTLRAELVQNDAKSFSPPVEQEIKFTTK